MWTLECEGDALARKKIWLRPGRVYLFGRTKPERRQQFQIIHRSISRQHLTLSVSTVERGESKNVHSKSSVVLKDEGSKFGTEVDGARVIQDSKTLKGSEHVFRLGNSLEIFKLKWHPVVFTFSLSAKETKHSKDPLAAYRARLEHLDIKVTEPFVPGVTTHVIAGKRNTAKGLSALIKANYIVSELFVQAVEEVSAPSDMNSEEGLSKLEEDFDANWPDALQYLPDKSREPSERPAKDFQPQPEREKVFEGYTFVFCDQTQFDTLQLPITNGAGKALLCSVEPGITTCQDIVRYVKTAAGEKGLGEFEDGSEGKGVVVVKFRAKGQYVDWAKRLDIEVAQALDHRLIEQSEFLNAILANDASMLRKPLLPSEGTPPPNGITEPPRTTSKAAKQNSTKPMEAPPKARKREAIVSRFRGYGDNDSDEEFSIGVTSGTLPSHSQANAEASEVRTQLNHIGSFSDSEDADRGSTANDNKASNSTVSRKRPAPDSPAEAEEDMVDQLLPAATAMKRRRIEAERNGTSPGLSFDVTPPTEQPKRKRPAKEVNIKEAVRERRKAEEEAAKRDEESLRDILDGMTVEQMKNLAVVEEMELPQRQARAQATSTSQNPRWKDEWNGRKNFKKFRRQGEGSQPQRGPRVMVTLEEVKKKDYGIGEDYWLDKESEGAKRRRKEKERKTQSQSHTQQRNSQSAPSHAAEVPSELVMDSLANASETVDLDAPRTTRRQEQTQQHSESTSTGRISTGKSSQPLMEKKGARNQMPALPNGARKRKKFAAARDSDNDSENEDDELQFRSAKRIK
ncbi:uncharacterized protein KY384_001835 [Bacidia gigantensis]|uniref:uncharacterized protein n=1 Tax=Bacidia gigantensis TaxID=2732470 RepID=UPI001D045544|nr:uncharacterized protein KY384_001835 [Bacidia gigantensis]KAG8533052.1 hypothetical protein KY384_001835 [Bacidia gigantensis]